MEPSHDSSNIPIRPWKLPQTVDLNQVDEKKIGP